MSKLVEKIRKLLNLARNAGASENEADVAQGLAEQMMSAAGLTEADLLESQVDLAATVREQTSDTLNRDERNYAGVIALAVSRMVGCRSYQSKRADRREKCNGCDRIAGDHEHFFEAGWCIVWIGSEPQRVAASELYAWVMRQVDRLANGARASARNADKPRQWMVAYRAGVASAIARSALEMSVTQVHQQLSTEALVMRNAVQRRIDELTPRLRMRKRRVRGDAFAAGKNDGSSVALRNSVTGGHKRLGSGS